MFKLRFDYDPFVRKQMETIGAPDITREKIEAAILDEFQEENAILLGYNDFKSFGEVFGDNEITITPLMIWGDPNQQGKCTDLIDGQKSVDFFASGETAGGENALYHLGTIIADERIMYGAESDYARPEADYVQFGRYNSLESSSWRYKIDTVNDIPQAQKFAKDYYYKNQNKIKLCKYLENEGINHELAKAMVFIVTPEALREINRDQEKIRTYGDALIEYTQKMLPSMFAVVCERVGGTQSEDYYGHKAIAYDCDISSHTRANVWRDILSGISNDLSVDGIQLIPEWQNVRGYKIWDLLNFIKESIDAPELLDLTTAKAFRKNDRITTYAAMGPKMAKAYIETQNFDKAYDAALALTNSSEYKDAKAAFVAKLRDRGHYLAMFNQDSKIRDTINGYFNITDPIYARDFYDQVILNHNIPDLQCVDIAYGLNEFSNFVYDHLKQFDFKNEEEQVETIRGMREALVTYLRTHEPYINDLRALIKDLVFEKPINAPRVDAIKEVFEGEKNITQRFTVNTEAKQEKLSEFLVEHEKDLCERDVRKILMYLTGGRNFEVEYSSEPLVGLGEMFNIDQELGKIMATISVNKKQELCFQSTSDAPIIEPMTSMEFINGLSPKALEIIKEKAPVEFKIVEALSTPLQDKPIAIDLTTNDLEKLVIAHDFRKAEREDLDKEADVRDASLKHICDYTVTNIQTLFNYIESQNTLNITKDYGDPCCPDIGMVDNIAHLQESSWLNVSNDFFGENLQASKILTESGTEYLLKFKTPDDYIYAHCALSKEGLQQGLEDIIGKITKDKIAQKTLSDCMDKGVFYAPDYQKITGACTAGTKDFIQRYNERHPEDHRDWNSNWTLNEILRETQGEFGYEVFVQGIQQWARDNKKEDFAITQDGVIDESKLQSLNSFEYTNEEQKARTCDLYIQDGDLVISIEEDKQIKAFDCKTSINAIKDYLQCNNDNTINNVIKAALDCAKAARAEITEHYQVELRGNDNTNIGLSEKSMKILQENMAPSGDETPSGDDER